MINGIAALLKFMNSTQSEDGEPKKNQNRSPLRPKKTYPIRNKVAVYSDVIEEIPAEDEVLKFAPEVSGRQWGYITRYRLWIQTKYDPMKVFVYVRKSEDSRYYCVKCTGYSRTSIAKVIEDSNGTARCFELASHGERCLELFDKVVVPAETAKRKYSSEFVDSENVSPVRVTRKRAKIIKSNSASPPSSNLNIAPVVIVIKPDDIVKVEPDDNSNDLSSPSTTTSSVVEDTKSFSMSAISTPRNSGIRRRLKLRSSTESSPERSITQQPQERILRSRSCVPDTEPKSKSKTPQPDISIAKKESEVSITNGYKTSQAELSNLRIPLTSKRVIPKSRLILGIQDNGVKDGKVIEIFKRNEAKCYVYTTNVGLTKPNVWKYTCADCRKYQKFIYAYKIVKSGVVLAADSHICKGRSLEDELMKQRKLQGLPDYETTKVVPSDFWILPCEENRIKDTLFIVSERNPSIGCRFIFQGKTSDGELIFTCQSCSILACVTCATVTFQNGNIVVRTDIDGDHEAYCFTVNLKDALSTVTRVLVNPKL